MGKSGLIKLIYFGLTAVLFTSCSEAQKTSLPEEKKEEVPYVYPSTIDTVTLKKYKDVMKADTYDAARLPEYRKFLEPYLAKKDGYAEYLYASTYDLYQYGAGKEADAKIAMEHYIKSSDLHYPPAHLFLYYVYRYSFMKIPSDIKKAIFYAERATTEGGNDNKCKAYGELAGLYYRPEEGSTMKPDTLKTIEYLEKALTYIPNDTWTMDFLSSLYEDKGRYQEAMKLRLASDNEQSRIKAALWMIEGKFVKKDIVAGVKILQDESAKIWPKYQEYMGSVNPVYELNRLYTCDKIITEQQVGKYIIGYVCGGG